MTKAEIVSMAADHDILFPKRARYKNNLRNGFTKDLLELALKSSGDSVWFWDVNSGQIKLDDTWIEHLGYEPRIFQFTFEWWDNSIKPEDKTIFEKALNDYLEGRKEHYEIEYQIRTSKGEWIWVWAIGKCIEYANDGKPLKFIGTHRDITILKQNQVTLSKYASELEREVLKRTKDLDRAVKEIKALKGIMPICSHCKEIRDDEGFWHQIESYIQNHSEAKFSHSLCPKCAGKFYPDEFNPYKNE